jgi:hypothetical protein
MTTEVIMNTENPHNKQNQQTSDSNVTTVDINDPNVKFPLENSWSFWFFKNEKSKEWKDNLKFITTVEFVEDFWGFVHSSYHIYFVSGLKVY